MQGGQEDERMLATTIALTLEFDAMLPTFLLSTALVAHRKAVLLQQPGFHALSNPPMLDHFQILRLALEHLIRIILRPQARHRPLPSPHRHPRIHRRHLLRNIRATPQQEIIHRLQPKQREEIPRQTADPPHIQIPRADAALQHGLELRRQRERQLKQDETREEGVDPAHDQGLRHHHRDVALHGAHHAVHGGGVGHGVGAGLPASVRVGEEGAVLVGGGEVGAAGGEGGGGKGGAVGAQVDAAEEGALLAEFGEGQRFRGGLQEDC